MAELTAAEKAEAKRRAALTDAQRTEEDRRAALTQEERDAEDLAAVNAELADENARTQGIHAPSASAGHRKAILEREIIARNKALRDSEATVEVTVRPGRHLFTEPGQTVPHAGGAKIMVTPQEEAALRAGGHLTTPDGAIPGVNAGPKVYQEAGLITGHGEGRAALTAKN